MKLRKNARYFVTDSNDRFAKLIPCVYRYDGRRLCEARNRMMHLFLTDGAPDSGVFVEDDLHGVEQFSSKRQDEINVAAEYYNEAMRVPSDKTLRRLLAEKNECPTRSELMKNCLCDFIETPKT